MDRWVWLTTMLVLRPSPSPSLIACSMDIIYGCSMLVFAYHKVIRLEVGRHGNEASPLQKNRVSTLPVGSQVKVLIFFNFLPLGKPALGSMESTCTHITFDIKIITGWNAGCGSLQKDRGCQQTIMIPVSTTLHNIFYNAEPISLIDNDIQELSATLEFEF